MCNYFILLFLLFFISTNSYSQKSIEVHKSGSKDIYAIDSVSKITFNVNKMDFSGVNKSHEINGVHKIVFSNADPIPIIYKPEMNKKYNIGNFYVRNRLSSIYIKFELNKLSNVNIFIYNSLGKKVVNLFSGKNVKDFSINWNGENENGIKVANGIYTIVALIENNCLTKHFVVLK